MTQPIRIWGFRGSLIGDMVMAVPLLHWCEKRWPGSYKHWQVARKCAQAAPLFYNHALINQLVISDCNEGMGPRDHKIAATCQVVFNVMPQHPEGDGWANKRDIYWETARMAGLTDDDWHSLDATDKRPYLVRWWEPKPEPKAIAIWPGARQGEKQKRTASWHWYKQLAIRLEAEGYKVYHCGHPNDHAGMGPIGRDVRELSFMDQIRFSLDCELTIGTDSGSLLAIAAFEQRPSISLLTNHIPGHVTNLHALAPNSPLNRVLFAADDPDLIPLDDVVAAVKEVT